jgi:hypothetical protein
MQPPVPRYLELRDGRPIASIAMSDVTAGRLLEPSDAPRYGERVEVIAPSATWSSNRS